MDVIKTYELLPKASIRPPNEPKDEAGDDQCDQENEREHDPALSACRRVRFCGCQHNVTLPAADSGGWSEP